MPEMYSHSTNREDERRGLGRRGLLLAGGGVAGGTAGCLDSLDRQHSEAPVEETPPASTKVTDPVDIEGALGDAAENGGGVVSLPANNGNGGVYPIEETIEWPTQDAAVELRGEPGVTLEPTMKPEYVFLIEDVKGDVRLTDLEITSDKADGEATTEKSPLSVYGVGDLELRHVHINNMHTPTNPTAFDAVFSNSGVATIEGCSFNHNSAPSKRVAVRMNAPGEMNHMEAPRKHLYVENTEVAHNHYHSFMTNGLESVSVNSCRAIENARGFSLRSPLNADNFEAYPASHIRVNNYVGINNEDYQLAIGFGAKSVAIANSTFHADAAHTGGDGSAINFDVIRGPLDRVDWLDEDQVAYDTYGTIMGNVVTGDGYRIGIRVNGANYVAVCGNVIEQTNRDGIMLADTHNTAVANNIIHAAEGKRAIVGYNSSTAQEVDLRPGIQYVTNNLITGDGTPIVNGRTYSAQPLQVSRLDGDAGLRSTAWDLVALETGEEDVTATLPPTAAVPAYQELEFIKGAPNNTATIQARSEDTLVGQSIELTDVGETVTVRSTGSQWVITEQ